MKKKKNADSIKFHSQQISTRRQMVMMVKSWQKPTPVYYWCLFRGCCSLTCALTPPCLPSGVCLMPGVKPGNCGAKAEANGSSGGSGVRSCEAENKTQDESTESSALGTACTLTGFWKLLQLLISQYNPSEQFLCHDRKNLLLV